MNDLYYPSEHALLCSWLNLSCPEVYQDIDLFDPPAGAEGIWPTRAPYANEDQAVANAVARIALGAIQNRLPQVGMFSGDGEVVLGRNYYPQPNRPVELLPQFLFMINWADTAPGLSWPESYHATYLPGYHRYVVTASQDSTDMWGYTELAIGWFDGDEGVLEGSMEVITDWWEETTKNSDDPRWEYVWEEGLVSRAEAESWADALWGDGDDVDAATRIIQTEGAGADEISEALHVLLTACIDSSPMTDTRQNAEEAFASCLDPGATPIDNLPGVIEAVGQLGRDGRYLVPQLMALLDDPRVAGDSGIRRAIVDTLDDSKPDGIAVHNRLEVLLTDASEPDELRRACAQTLHTITGLEEYLAIRAMFPRGGGVRAAPHDSSIFRGGREWYEPKPTKTMRRAASQALSKLSSGQPAQHATEEET